MFTGIVEQVGVIASTFETETGRRLTLNAKEVDGVPLGSSVAVNGVCLTVVAVTEGEIQVDVIPETLARTNLGGLSSGSSVNLELAMSASGRFDGHIVQGHVDGVGSVESVDRADGAVEMRIEAGEDLARHIVEKGSITVDGVSLTVAGIEDRVFSVALIPHTLEVTTLGLRAEGDTVNLETDVLAKYVERLLEPHL